ncbi:unnamed protein product [Adineta ricciae]|uniref:PDZ domain-containing protein n=1 Tax=Adineta ricciae TaxID=249248 RepID=A0A815PP68_ADIRI|nr:unnamed protein product [Adineta ricciae]
MQESLSASKFFLSLFVTEPDIRLCITILRADATDPTGFELVYDNKKHYHSINTTSDRNDGPFNTKSAGIKSGDRLIEMNGQSIEHLVPKVLRKHIHNIRYPDPLQMLVIDTSTYDDCQTRNERIHQNLPNVQIMPSNQRTLCLYASFSYSICPCFLSA